MSAARFTVLKTSDDAFLVSNVTELINAVTAVEAAGGGKIVLNPGTYVISTLLLNTSTSNISLEGSSRDACIIQAVSSGFVGSRMIRFNSGTSFTMKNITMDGNGVNSLSCIDFDGGQDDTLIDNCRFINSGGTFSIGLQFAGASDRVKITNCLFNGLVTHLTLGAASLDNIISNNNFTAGTSGINFDNSGARSLITGNAFEGLTTGITPRGDFTISGNTFEGMTTAINVAANAAQDSIITGNMFENNTSNMTVSSTGNDELKVVDNSAPRTYTSPGTMNGYDSHITFTGTTGTYTLPDLNEQSQGHRIWFDSTNTNTITITPTNFANGTSLGLNSTTDTCVMEWSGAEWVLIENGTGGNVSASQSGTAVTNIATGPSLFRNSLVKLNGRQYMNSTIWTVTCTAAATLSEFRFALPNFTSFNDDRDVIVQASGYTSSDIIINNVTGRGDNGTNNILVSFTSVATSLNHFLQVNCVYSTDN